MIRRPPRSTQSRSSAASDVYKRQPIHSLWPRSTSSAYPLSAGGRPQRCRAQLTQRTCLTSPTYRTKPALQGKFLQGRFAFVEGGDATTGDSVKPLYTNTTNLFPGGTMIKRTIAFLLDLT